jgi:hypothetical protein
MISGVNCLAGGPISGLMGVVNSTGAVSPGPIFRSLVDIVFSVFVRFKICYPITSANTI